MAKKEVPSNCRECKHDSKCTTYYGSAACVKKQKKAK